MTKYECPTIFRADISEEETQKLDGFVRDILTRHGAQLSDPDVWGKRRMAYEIKRQRDGYYTIYKFEMEPDGGAVAEIRRMLGTNDDILRAEIVKIPLIAEKHKQRQQEMARKRAEQAQREARETAKIAEDEEEIVEEPKPAEATEKADATEKAEATEIKDAEAEDTAAKDTEITEEQQTEEKKEEQQAEATGDSEEKMKEAFVEESKE